MDEDNILTKKNNSFSSVKSELINSFLAGILIAIGGTVFLSCHNKIVGAFLFSVALLCICMESLALYTGKICYLLNSSNKCKEIAKLSAILLGNIMAALLCALILKNTNPTISKIASDMCALKLNKNIFRIFIDSAFCGILIYLAVNIYKLHKSVFGIFLCVPVFILSGFEHCIADIFYFLLAKNLSLIKVTAFILIAIAGNTAGGLVFPILKSFTKKNAK